MTSAKQTGRRRPHRGQQTQRFQGELRRILEIRRDVVDPRGIAAGAGRAEDDEQQNDAEGVAHESLASAFGIVAAAGLDEADYTDDQGREPPSRVPAAKSMNPTRGASSPKCAPSRPIRLWQERRRLFFFRFSAAQGFPDQGEVCHNRQRGTYDRPWDKSCQRFPDSRCMLKATNP